MKKKHDSERCLLHMLIIYVLCSVIAAVCVLVSQNFADSRDAAAIPDAATTISPVTDVASLLSADEASNNTVSEAATSEAVSSEVSSEAAAAETVSSETEETTISSDTVSDDTQQTSATRFHIRAGTGKLNVRAKPDASSQLLGRIDENTSGDIIEQGDTWSLIKTDDELYGYVMNSYIETGEAQ